MWIWLPKMLVDVTIQDEFVSQVLCLRRQRVVQRNMNKRHHSLRQVFDGSVQDDYLQDVLLYVSLNYGCGYLLVYFVLLLVSNELCMVFFREVFTSFDSGYVLDFVNFSV